MWPFHIAKRLGIVGHVVSKKKQKYVLAERRTDLLQPREVAQALLERRGRIVDEFGYVNEKVVKVLAHANLSLFSSLSIDRKLAELLIDRLLKTKVEDLLYMPDVDETLLRVAVSMYHLYGDLDGFIFLHALLAPVYFFYPEEVARALCAKLSFK